MVEQLQPPLTVMRLRVLMPTEILVDEEVMKVVAEADNGSFCLLPRHIDFVSAVVPGLLSFSDLDGEEHYVAIDEGVLVKTGFDVCISTLDGARGPDLEDLQGIVEEQFLVRDEYARKARSALARLEAGALRGFRGLQGPYGER